MGYSQGVAQGAALGFIILRLSGDRPRGERRAGNPKAEIRRPKEARNPKSKPIQVVGNFDLAAGVTQIENPATQFDMDQARITQWLHGWVRRQTALNLLGGAGVLFAGAGILVLTWGLVYMVSIFALGPWLGYHHWIHTLLGLVLIPALFWGNVRTSREYLSEYSVTVGTSSQAVVNFHLPGVGLVSNVNPLAPGTMHAGVKMITDCLYSGPRVVMAGFRMWICGLQLRKIDLDGCAAIITVLFAAQRKLSFQDIVNSINWIDPTVVFPQMRFIEGVIFLAADPAGLTLSQDLRQTLRSHLTPVFTAI